MKHPIGNIILIFIFFLFVGTFSQCVKFKEKYRICVVLSYAENYQTSMLTKRDIENEFFKRGYNVECRYVYLNEMFEKHESPSFLDNYMHSFAEWNLNLILVSGDIAANDIIRSNSALIKSKPVVFMGLSYCDTTLLYNRKNFTGWFYKPDYVKNCKMIRDIIGTHLVFTLLETIEFDNLNYSVILIQRFVKI